MNAARKPAVKATRVYRSDLRTEAAAQTRASILDTAMRLFVERGYAHVTVNDIAREAKLASPTVYASAGGKAAILATLIDQRQRGDAIVEQAMADVRRSRSGEEIIAITARATRKDNERFRELLTIMVSAAAVDDGAAQVLARADDVYREALGRVGRRLKSIGATAQDVSSPQALDILWFHFGHGAWRLLVGDRRWSWDRAEAFLAGQACAALLA